MTNAPVKRAGDPAADLLKPTWVFYPDLMRVLAVIAVVLLHVAARGIVMHTPLETVSWWVCNGLEGITRWCVPLFVMLSGALLLGRRGESLGTFYRKRFLRVGIPTLFWSAFYLVGAWAYGNQSITVTKAAGLIALGTPYYHLHFMFIIMGLYLFTPMLRLYVQQADRRTRLLTVVLALSLASASAMFSVAYGARLTAASRFLPYVGYFLAGDYLRDVRLSRRGLAVAWGVAALSVATTVFGTAALIARIGMDGGTALYSFLSPTNVALSLAVFLIIRTLADGKAPTGRTGWVVSRWLAPATLGVYLAHPAFQKVFEKVGGVLWREHPLPGLLLGFILVTAASFLATAVLLRIPVIRRTVG